MSEHKKDYKIMNNNIECVESIGGPNGYGKKDKQYFAGARRDFISRFPNDKNARILEIGCGNGDTGVIALAEGKCGVYCGIELFEPAAALARQQITEVEAGDVEKIELPWPHAWFDGLIMSEVLEHLVDPWAVLRKLRPLLKPGALVFASSPNVSHYSVIYMLVKGRWDMTDTGILDRTHLRWFTIRSYREMFEASGYRVDHAEPLIQVLGVKGIIFNTLTIGRLRHLLARQISLAAHCE